MLHSFWQVFRVIFVLFSLYLLGDAFFRWDGFSYYASFSEFLPAIALVSILWSMTAVLLAALAWALFALLNWLFNKTDWIFSIERFIFFMCTVGSIGLLSWRGKRLIWPTVHSYLFKISIVLGTILIAIFIMWLFRKKIDRWVRFVQERFTPLVWIFSLFVIFSVPVVAYHAVGNQIENETSETNVGSQSRGDEKANIILVTFDALTSRDMSVYGYHRETTPFISEWAKTASLFTMAEAEGNNTYSTTISLISGKRVWSHYAFQAEGFKTERTSENLAVTLKNNGYYNVVYTGNKFATPKYWGIEEDFDVIRNIGAYEIVSFSFLGILDELLYKLFVDKIILYNWIIKEDFLLYKILLAVSPDNSRVYLPPENAFDDFLKAVDDNKVPEPYFVWFHFYPPHLAYVPPEPYMGMFNSSSEFRSARIQEMDKEMIRENYALYPEETQPTINILRDRYNESIRYCDNQFGRFMARLKKKEGLKNTVIFLSSDHGESFEHGFQGHSGIYLYEQITHIPLIIKDYRKTEGRIINDMVEQIDIPATILDLANIPVPTWMEGRSLLPLMRGETLVSRPAFSGNFHKNPVNQKIRQGTVAVWDGDYKLIHYFDTEEEKSLLFNLKKDPDELNNLFDIESEMGQHLLTLIKKNLKKAVKYEGKDNN